MGNVLLLPAPARGCGRRVDHGCESELRGRRESRVGGRRKRGRGGSVERDEADDATPRSGPAYIERNGSEIQQ